MSVHWIRSEGAPASVDFSPAPIAIVVLVYKRSCSDAGRYDFWEQFRNVYYIILTSPLTYDPRKKKKKTFTRSLWRWLVRIYASVCVCRCGSFLATNVYRYVLSMRRSREIWEFGKLANVYYKYNFIDAGTRWGSWGEVAATHARIEKQ